MLGAVVKIKQVALAYPSVSERERGSRLVASLNLPGQPLLHLKDLVSPPLQ